VYTVGLENRKIYMDNKIEPIPDTMEKFFGCAGKMIKPSTDGVQAHVKKINKGRLITLEQLRKEIAKEFEVEVACPAGTLKALQLLSQEVKPVCYWRVVKKSGELISKFPGSFEGHGSLLEREGFQINYERKVPVVIGYESYLV